MEIEVAVVTPAAQLWIESRGDASLLHVFPKSINLVDSKGSMVSIVTRRDALSPFSMWVKWPRSKANSGDRFDSWLSIDSPISFVQTGFRIGELSFRHMMARSWSPTVDWDGIQIGKLVLHLAILEHALREYKPAGSLFEILEPQTDNPYTEAASTAWKVLSTGLSSVDTAQIEEGVKHLAGLGSGLTPAGDDFLIGVIYALRILGPDQYANAIRTIITSAEPRTTTLSAAWLRAASNGEAGLLWHDLFIAICRGDEEDILASTVGIIAHGQTSGADALTGFIAAVRQLISFSYPRDHTPPEVRVPERP